MTNPIEAIVARALRRLHPFEAVTKQTGVGMGPSVTLGLAEAEIRQAVAEALELQRANARRDSIERAALAYAAAGDPPDSAAMRGLLLVEALEESVRAPLRDPIAPFKVDPVLTDIAINAIEALHAMCPHRTVVRQLIDEHGGEWGRCTACGETGFPLNDAAAGGGMDPRECGVTGCLEPLKP